MDEKNGLNYLNSNNFLKIAVIQLQATDSVEINLESILRTCSALDKDVRVAFLPENCLYLRVKEGELIPPILLDSEAIKKIDRLSKQLGLVIFLGSVAVPSNFDNGKMMNATILLTPDNSPSVVYSKIHLFDIQLEGQRPIRESDVFAGGSKAAIVNSCGWSFGLTICYDLRFSNLFLNYAKQGVDAILVPSSFLKGTGRDHWEVLLRARAIESQCYIIAAAQAGTHRSSKSQSTRETYGHSMVIDPWGTIVGKLDGESPGVLQIELNRSAIEKVRQQIPMAAHRTST